MLIKVIIVLIMGMIVISLFRAMFFLVKDDKGDSKRTVNALTYRVMFSIALLLLLVLSASQGWIRPHSVGGSNMLQDAEILKESR